MRTDARAVVGLVLAAFLTLGLGGVASAAVNDSLGVAATQHVVQPISGHDHGNHNSNPGNSGGNPGSNAGNNAGNGLGAAGGTFWVG
ncbi:hypothetical protein [Saccharopolyspora phatthalungensis]|uniref:Secreted protein n=1 Tax=Saccharopolyspora phatthalungensis TaxID=664693 RepID=A0A840QF13_9PSEU|nr:hypothetical protein [Saccharopolyspora phatthalungensis]MBB5159016.1 hypothetical protein [Saccharopolyspora phatthalungensis]